MKQTKTPRQPPESVSSSFVSSDFVQQATSGTGLALPSALRDHLEPSFGHNFANVRVFHDDQAASASAALGAKAFTFGQDIVFGAGHYQPDAPQGLRLLTHELTHTIQQGQVFSGADRYALGQSGDAFERQASATSSAVMGGRGVAAIAKSAPAIQCELEEEELVDLTPYPASSTASVLPSAFETPTPTSDLKPSIPAADLGFPMPVSDFALPVDHGLPEEEMQVSMSEMLAPPSALESPADQGIPETSEQRRQRIMAADKPLEKDLYDDIVQGLPGGLVGGGMRAGGVGMLRALSGATRGPLAMGALEFLEEHNPFSGTNVEKSGDRLLKMAGVNQ